MPADFLHDEEDALLDGAARSVDIEESEGSIVALCENRSWEIGVACLRCADFSIELSTYCDDHAYSKTLSVLSRHEPRQLFFPPASENTVRTLSMWRDLCDCLPSWRHTKLYSPEHSLCSLALRTCDTGSYSSGSRHRNFRPPLPLVFLARSGMSPTVCSPRTAISRHLSPKLIVSVLPLPSRLSRPQASQALCPPGTPRRP